MSAHTPGPWEVWADFNIRAAGRRTVASSGGYSDNTRDAEVHEENCANARLIAAAPELLEALRGLAGDTPGPNSRPCWCNEDDCQCRNRAWCVAARAATAKAEGR